MFARYVWGLADECYRVVLQYLEVGGTEPGIAK